MKLTGLLLVCCIFLMPVAGCQSAGRDVEEAVEGQRQFPEVMVGVWEAEVTKSSKWGIKFEPDGSILKIIYSAEGPVYLAENDSHWESESEQAYYIFDMGPSEVNYTPSTRVLKVEMVMDYIIKVSFEEMKGQIKDYFEGPVSEDGRTWEVEWRNYSWVQGTQAPAVDSQEAKPTPLVFNKIDIK
ncbi:MAG: hypothetical protein ACYS0C_02065 [Planctomycetota bacterium]|jgi:hypothetical protein